ncbi:MAG TPA: uridine diphosphate-N-acetylglucosamine-binding protein YvcK [Frankiaceae bacterium]|nr:uridine diphosphate-N-acetylglucosamine-binding protein YvcK [Frankiaceae bacterium]
MTAEARSAVPSVVAFGGGHGLAASLGALRQITPRLTAVVTVADDGGSSGRLRAEFGMLPPGDLRMALATLAAEDAESASWADVLQHRFNGFGSLSGHAVGNLLLAGLVDHFGDPVAALDAAARLLHCAGRVLPLSTQAIDIAAEVSGLDPGRRVEVRGQVAVATTRGRVESVRLLPARPPACPEALDAVGAADVLVLGPGSLFTSMLPHLLVPEMAQAVQDARAHRVLVLNLAPQPGETAGFAPETHLEVLAQHAPALRFDVVIADPAAVADSSALRHAAKALGAEVQLSSVAVGDEPRHDPTRLAAAFRQAFEILSVQSPPPAHKPRADAYRSGALSSSESVPRPPGAPPR